MKKKHAFLILLVAVFFFACAGGNSVKKKPMHLTSGMKEIKKGTAWYQRGCYKRSLEHFFKAHELFAASDQLSGVAMSMNNIGNVYRIINDINSAVLFYEESYDIYTDIKDNHGVVQALSNKAAAMIDGEMLEEADSVLDTAEEIAQKSGISLIPLHINRGLLFIKKKEFKRAEEILENVLEITDTENLAKFAAANFVLGNLMLETKRYKKAVDFFETALVADRSSGFHRGIAGDLAAIGSICHNQGKNELAAKYFKRSIKIYALMENKEKVRHIMEQLEKVAEKTGMDISVTKLFVNRWLDGKAHASPCR